MNQSQPRSSTPPQFSVVIPVYNDWIPLRGCLQSLAEQDQPPSVEVILVDDGSVKPPDVPRDWTLPFPVSLINQPHRGIPSARNRGIRNSKGDVLLFVDADCRLEAGCLRALAAAIARSPQHDCFQLRLKGDRSNLVGRAEELRLSTFQNFVTQPDGRIRYLNTAGFAIRRSRVESGEVFHPEALRGEDTLLLASLMRAGELPLFVPDAVVEHSIPLSLPRCLRKDVKTVFLEGAAYDMILLKGVKIRLTHIERLRVVAAMWRAAWRNSLGISAWLVVLLRQATQRVATFAYRYLRSGSASLSRQL